ncbi:MAG: hypothetical protein EA370_02600 [Wenzhouxiangella sp.]|nr:MAG: hypothetical protein EA370_02600 [Wenzhouxiangella sp.]
MAPDQALMQQARSLLSAGRAAEAADLCLQGLRDAPADPALLTLLGRCDEARGDFEGALSRLESAVAENPEYLVAQFHLGRLLAAVGRMEEARTCFDHCLALDPNHAPARTLSARLDALAGNRDQAIAGLRTALRADARHVPALSTLAELLVEAGQLDEANELASRALRINPSLSTAQMSMARVLLAQGHPAFAEQCLRNASESAPQDPAPYFLLAQLKGQQGQFEQALAAFDAARQRGHAGPELLLGRARCLRSLGRHEQAREQYEALVSHAEAAPALILEAAEFCIEADLPGPARVLLARPAVRQLPTRILLLAQLAEREGDVDQARQLAETLHDSEAVGVATAARRLSARLALLADDGKQALDVLAPLLEQADCPVPVVWLGAEIRQSLEDHEGAVASLEQLLARPNLGPPEKARTHSRLVTVLDRAERYQEASKHMRAAEWRAPVVVGSAHGPDAEAWQKSLDGFAQVTVANDGRPQPIFVTGLPGTGRELWLAALAASGQVLSLPRSGFAERRRLLEIPSDPARVATLDEAGARMIRRRYLRAHGRLEAPRSVLLESGLVSAIDLAWLARVFPGATVLAPTAEEADLRMHWRLAGYRDQGQMLSAWQSEQALLEDLRAIAPIDWQVLPLGDLYQDPGGALAAVAGHLGLQPDANMLSAMDRARIELGYRAPGHWQHYRFEG